MTTTAVGHLPVARVARGLSLVELMVGVVVGLFIVAAAAMLVSGQLSENRKLLLETQLQQDMRSAADIITRELRRIGTRRGMDQLLGASFVGASAHQNDFNNVTLAGTDPADISFSYDRRAGEAGPYRFVLQGGAIRTQPGVGPLQELTDSNVMTVTKFAITLTTTPSIRIPCAHLCPSGDVDCWPELRTREFDITIEAQSKSDASVKRALQTHVRLPNDWVKFNITGPPAKACPA